MAKFDWDSIKLQIATQRGSRDAIGAVMDRKANDIVEDNKAEFIEEFVKHPVSEEIEDGVSATNISGTLDGKGNLFTFIGFPIGDKPIEEVVGFINEDIKLDPNSKIQGRDNKGRFKAGGTNLLFDYKVDVKKFNEDIVDKTPLPWEPTKSWLFGIEKGIAGFTSYIYWKNAGRSTGGLQANDGRDANGRFNGSGKPIKLRDGKFNNIPYFSAIYKDFRNLFKGTNEI